MKKFGTLMTVLLGLGILGACTGTSEPQAPTLLIVGVQTGATPELALVQDVHETGTTAIPRLSFVAGSQRALPEPAVSIDLTARDAERDTAWVLTRSVSAGAVSAHLVRFAVTDIDPADPLTGFSQLGTPVALTGPAGAVLDAASAPGRTVCPTDVSSSRDGRYVLLLDDPTACVPASTDPPLIWQLNTMTGDAVQLQSTNQILPVPPYTDQRADGERGYFLVSAIDSAQVYATDFAGSVAPEPSVTLPPDPRGIQDAVDPSDFVDLSGSTPPQGSGRPLLVALNRNLVLGVDLQLPGVGTDMGPAETISDPRIVLVDPFARSSRIMVVSNSQVAVHDDLEDDEEEVIAFGGVAGVIDSLWNYAYVVRAGQILVIDLLTGLTENDPLASRVFDFTELSLPPGGEGVISWVRAAEPPPTP